MSLSNESSSLLLKVSHLVARYTFYLNVLLIIASEVQAGGHLLERVLAWGGGQLAQILGKYVPRQNQ